MNRGTFKNTFESFITFGLTFLREFKVRFKFNCFVGKLNVLCYDFRGSRRFTKDFYSDAKCIISHIHTLSRRFWLYADRFLMSFTIILFVQSCGKTANQVENNVFEELGIYKSGSGIVCERLYCLWGKGKSKDVRWAELSVIDQMMLKIDRIVQIYWFLIKLMLH